MTICHHSTQQKHFKLWGDRKLFIVVVPVSNHDSLAVKELQQLFPRRIYQHQILFNDSEQECCEACRGEDREEISFCVTFCSRAYHLGWHWQLQSHSHYDRCCRDQTRPAAELTEPQHADSAVENIVLFCVVLCRYGMTSQKQCYSVGLHCDMSCWTG